MEHNKPLLSIATILALIIGFVLGYLLGTRPFSISKTINLKTGDNTENSEKDKSIAERPKLNLELTADEAMQIADRDALNWSNDAFISEISLFSNSFTTDGKSNGWKFAYYSKTKEKLFEIVVKDGESRGGEENISKTARQTLKGELVDSRVLAKVFFGSNPAGTLITSLVMRYEPSAKKFMWVIFSEKGSHTLDAEI